MPLPTGPLEHAAGGEVVDLRPTAGRARRPVLTAAGLAISSSGEGVARVAAAGESRWLIQGLWSADAYGCPTPSRSWPATTRTWSRPRLFCPS